MACARYAPLRSSADGKPYHMWWYASDATAAAAAASGFGRTHLIRTLVQAALLDVAHCDGQLIGQRR